MNNNKYLKFMIKVLLALVVVLMIPKLFHMATDPETGLFKSNANRSVIEQRASKGDSKESGVISKADGEAQNGETKDDESEGGPISNSVIGGAVKDYLEDTLEKSGAADAGEAKNFVGEIFSTIEGWIKRSDGKELDDVLEIDSVRKLLETTGVNPDEVDSKSVFDALK